MSQSIITFTSWWPPIIVLILSSIFLVLLVRFSGYDETGKPIKQPKPRKMTLTDWILSGIILVFVILIIVLILFLIGDKLAIATIDCYNCTGLN